MSPEVNAAIASLEQSVRNLVLKKVTGEQLSSSAQAEIADSLTAAQKLEAEELDAGAREMVRFSKAVCAQIGGIQSTEALPLDPTEQDIIKKLSNIGQIQDITAFHATIKELGAEKCQEIIFKHSVQRYCSDPLGKPEPSQLYIGLYNIFDTLAQTSPDIKRIQPPHEAARTSFYKMSQMLADHYKKTGFYKEKLKLEKTEIFKNGVAGMKATLEATASLTDENGKAIKDKLLEKMTEIESAVEKLHSHQVQYLNGELRQLMAQYVSNIAKNLENSEVKEELEKLNEENEAVRKILQGTAKEQLGSKLTLNMTGPAFQDVLEVTGKALIEATVSTLDPTDKRIESAKKTDKEFRIKLEKNACETDIIKNAKLIINKVIDNVKLQIKLQLPQNYIEDLKSKLRALEYSGSDPQALSLKRGTEQEVVESAKAIVQKISDRENRQKTTLSALWMGIKKSVNKNISEAKQAMKDIQGWFMQLENTATKLNKLQESPKNENSELSKTETQKNEPVTKTHSQEPPALDPTPVSAPLTSPPAPIQPPTSVMTSFAARLATVQDASGQLTQQMVGEKTVLKVRNMAAAQAEQLSPAKAGLEADKPTKVRNSEVSLESVANKVMASINAYNAEHPQVKINWKVQLSQEAGVISVTRPSDTEPGKSEPVFSIKQSAGQTQFEFQEQPKMSLEAAIVALSACESPVEVNSEDIADMEMLVLGTQTINESKETNEKPMELTFSEETMEFLESMKAELGKFPSLKEAFESQSNKDQNKVCL